MHGSGTLEFENFFSSRNFAYIWRPWETIWLPGSLSPNIDHIEQLKKAGLSPVVDMSLEHWGNGGPTGSIHLTYDLLDNTFENFVVLCHDPKDDLTKKNLLYFPYWYYKTKNQFVRQITDNVPKKYKVSCLNGEPRSHRKANWVELSEKHYRDQIFKTMTINSGFDHINDCADLTPEIWSKWKQLADLDLLVENNLRSSWYLKPNSMWDHSVDNTQVAYTDSYINLVTESSIAPEIFITEKTWKAVASGQLFIIMGNSRCVQHLRELGVDTFDDVIDHDYYDIEPDWNARLQKLHSVLDYLISKDLEKIWHDTVERRRANQVKFDHGDFGQGHLDRLINRLSR